MTNTISAVSVTLNSTVNFTQTPSAQSASDGNVIGSLIDDGVISQANYRGYAAALLGQENVENIDHALLTILSSDRPGDLTSNRTLDAVAQLYATFKPELCFPNSTTTMDHEALMRQLRDDTSMPDLGTRIAPDYFSAIRKTNETPDTFTLVLPEASLVVNPAAIHAGDVERLLDELSERLAAHLSRDTVSVDDADESEAVDDADNTLSPPNARTWETRAQTHLAPTGSRGQLFSGLLESPDHLHQALTDLPNLVSMRDERGDTILHHAARADFGAVNAAAVKQSIDLLLAHEKTDFRPVPGDTTTIMHYAALNAVNEHVFEKFVDRASRADLSHQVDGLNVLQRVVTARNNGVGASIDGPSVPPTLLPRAKLADILLGSLPRLVAERSSSGKTALDYALEPQRHEGTFEVALVLAKAIPPRVPSELVLAEAPDGSVRGLLVLRKISKELDLSYAKGLKFNSGVAPGVAERLQLLNDEIALLGRLIGFIKR
jgi:hypothetical protein